MAALSARRLAGAAALLLIPVLTVGKELYVHPGESIAAVIAQAAPGDTILVARGRYEERLRIDKPLTLKGIGRPTLSGALEGDVIRITVPDVTIENFIVTDSGDDLTAQNAGVYIQPGADRATIRNCDIAYSLFGIWIEGVKDVRILDNLITGKREYASAQRGNGIQLYNTTGARIIGNHISFVRDGIYVDVSHHAIFRGNHIHHARYGTHYMNSYYNVWEHNDVHHNRGGLALMETRNQVVRNNRAWSNSDHGFMLRTIQDSTIDNNVAAGNQRGFFIYDAEYNALRNNLVVGNAVGMHVWAGSINNIVERNDFIHNQQQIRYIATRDVAWGVEQGNYWSNYVGWDRDGDGRGDTPYEANPIVDQLVQRLPIVKLLMSSPALQTLRLAAQQFPVLRAPSIVDPRPQMRPAHSNWREWHGRAAD
ncbi:MAG TPA: nitrous oxide reductase family maturation protein NosD [Steroidobacteraceae bacterium]